MKHIALILIICIFPTFTFGTTQIPDELKIDGKTYFVKGFELSEDMSKYFNKHIDKYDDCSANWDGYTATLTILDKKLFVIKLDVGCEFLVNKNYQSPNPKEIFGVSIPTEGLFADWFSGVLKNYYGDEFAGIFSNIRVFTFKKGILSDVKEIENEFYKKTKEMMENHKTANE